MNSESRCKLLADKILEIFRKGFHINNDTLEFISSTFATTSPEGIQKILQDENSCERDSLLDLIFFPGISIQAQLEHILEKNNFQTSDRKIIKSLLVKQGVQSAIYLSGNLKIIELDVPEFITELFITRLNIQKKTEKRIMDSIKNHTCIVKVKLRNSRISFTENKILFVCDFLQSSIRKADIFLPCLDFILEIIDEAQDTDDIFKFLIEKKIFYYECIKKGGQDSEKLKKYNVEILILQGTRMPCINTADLRKKIEFINRISLAVFGIKQEAD